MLVKILIYSISFVLFFSFQLRAEIFCVDVIEGERNGEFREIRQSSWSNEVSNASASQNGFVKGIPRAGIKVLHEMYYRVDYPQKSKPKGTKLLIHGLGDHSGRLNQQAENYLKDGFKVIRVDLLGHGRSLWKSLKNDANVDETVDIRAHALSILKVLEHLNVKNVEIVGHSLGGAVALLTGAYSKNILDKKLEIKISGIRLIAFYAQDLSEWIASQALIGAQVSETLAKGVQFFAPKLVSENVTNQIDQSNFLLNQFFSTADSMYRFLGFTTLKNSITDPNVEKFLYSSYSTYFEEYAKANGLDMNDPELKKEIDQQIRSAISVTRGARLFNLFHPRQELPRIEIPFEIIAGQEDEIVPLAMMKQSNLVLKEMGYKVRFTIIKNAGHLLTRTHPGVVYKALKKGL